MKINGQKDNSLSKNKRNKKIERNDDKDKTLINSVKKLIVSEQYSLGNNKNQMHTKKPSETLALSYRQKNHTKYLKS